MEELELLFYWFDNNIFAFDRNNHNDLKITDTEYVTGKIYFSPEDEGIFTLWAATNPEKLYDKRAFLIFCHQELERRMIEYSDQLRTTFGPFYNVRVAWGMTLS